MPISKKTKQYRVSNGLCMTCGNPVEDTEYMNCKTCRDYKAKKSLERRHTLRDSGVCYKCGKVKTDKGICDNCRNELNTRKNKLRKFSLSIGICPRCNKNALYDDGYKSCIECRTMNKKYNENRKYVYDHEREMSRYYRLKEEGICVVCRKRMAEPNRTRCSICAAKLNENQDRIRVRKSGNALPRSEWVSYGFCYSCGQELDTDKRLCRKCCESKTKSLPTSHRNEYWSRLDRLIYEGKGKSNV